MFLLTNQLAFQYIMIIFHWRIQGAHPARAPLKDPILLFRHKNFTKRSRIGSWRPLRGGRPPAGNPGSATVFIHKPFFGIRAQSFPEISPAIKMATLNFDSWSGWTRVNLVRKAGSSLGPVVVQDWYNGHNNFILNFVY